MIATLIFIFSLFRDLRWPKFESDPSSSTLSKILLDDDDKNPRQVLHCHSTTANRSRDQRATNNNRNGGNMQNEDEHAENGASGTPIEERRTMMENERVTDDDNAGQVLANHPKANGTEKRSSETSSISTSVSTEQTQIDATSSGTLPSASSPLTPGSQLLLQQLSIIHQQQQQQQQSHSSSDSSAAHQTTTSSSATMNNSTAASVGANNSSTNNLRGYRHEHRLLSNSSTDTISALNNLSSHSEGGYGAAGATTTTTTTGSGHSGVITYPFKIRGDSTASTISTSACSEVLLPPDGRRSSEGTRLVGHRRSSGRIRRYAPRTTISSGGRRRTTGRYILWASYFVFIW